jgi:hypothetical protein
MLALMVICPARLPAPLGVNVTWMAQLDPATTLVLTQLSVSLKSPFSEMAVTAKALLPVF